MAKEKPPEPPPEDIPAWFMTYSDVITLLMTFFILLLTFSTTEPEKFEKVQVSAFGASGATGVAGKEHEAMENQSWVQRVRPRASRIAMDGSEMPPMMDEPSNKAVGKGLEAVDDEVTKKDIMTTNSFQMKLAPLVNENENLTSKGLQVAGMIANQTRRVPVNCSIQISNPKLAKRATRFLSHLYRVEGVRPGLVSVGYAVDVDSLSVRFVMERFLN